jgi:hypothetical protein
VLTVYNYLKKVVDGLTRQYRMLREEDLECFIMSIPDIEIVCDQAEDLMMNKYYRGQAPRRKIYFKQEDIFEIQYFLQRDNRPDVKDDTKTAASERVEVTAV